MSKNYVLAITKDINKLSTRCDEINVFENQKLVRTIVNNLKDTMKANKDMFALSAPQLGYKVRIFCIRFSDEDIKAFINPMVTKVEGKCLMIENTDSLPGQEFMIQRSQRLMAGYQMVSGQYNELSLKHPVSALFEKMLDMLDGTLFFKYETIALPIDKDYYTASTEEKEELHKWYFDTYLPARLEELNKAADSDEEIKQLQTQIKYFKSVIEGTTETVPVYEDGRIDLENSSKKVAEEEAQGRKEYIDSIKKKFGVE